MKKLMAYTTLALLTLSANLHAQQVPPYVYDGPEDDSYLTGTSYYFGSTYSTTLGKLARYSNIIGVGQVSNKQDRHFTVTVDHALVGCTNGAVIVMYGSGYFHGPGPGGESRFYPTNNSRIVFAASTNHFMNAAEGIMYWNLPEAPLAPDFSRPLPHLTLHWLNRSWWYVDRDDGVLTTQFTNVLQAVRFDRNWTNYFHLVRDGVTSTSDRVREDSHWDMYALAKYATHAQRPILLADPLVDHRIKAWLNNPNWGRPDFEEP